MSVVQRLMTKNIEFIKMRFKKEFEGEGMTAR